MTQLVCACRQPTIVCRQVMKWGRKEVTHPLMPVPRQLQMLQYIPATLEPPMLSGKMEFLQKWIAKLAWAPPVRSGAGSPQGDRRPGQAAVV